MKRRYLILIPSIFLFNFNFAQSSSELIIQTQPNVKIEDFVKIFFQKHQIKIFVKEAIIPKKGIYLIQNNLRQSFDNQFVTKLKNESQIKFVQKNRVIDFRNTEPNDPLFSEQWNLHQCQFPRAWDITTGGKTADEKEIVVAVIDSGFLPSHPDFEGQLYVNPDEIPDNDEDDDLNGIPDDVHGYNFQSDTSIYGNHEHGTRVAGVLGAKTDNELGISGAAWNVKMMLIQAAREDHVLKAYEYILQERKKYNESNGEEGSFIVAVNASWGFKDTTCDSAEILKDYYDDFGEHGILYVVAARNKSINIDTTPDFPTDCPNDFLITITNSSRSDSLIENAGFGKNTIDLAAPGVEVHTTENNGGFLHHTAGGTSFSTPLVSAAVALLYSVPCEEFSNLVMSQPANAALLVKEAILEGAEKTTGLRGKVLTEGRLNIYNSLNYLHGYCTARSEEQEEGNFDEVYLEEEELVRVYPNPVFDILKIDYSVPNFGMLKLKVFNILGQLIFEKEIETKPFENQTTEINMSDWAAGAYILAVGGEEKKTSVRLVKQ